MEDRERIDMEFAVIKEWLDKQIAWRNDGIALKKFNSQIEALDIQFDEYKSLHCWGADVVANNLGIELQRERFDNETDLLYFMYEGYKVFCLKDKAYAG